MLEIHNYYDLLVLHRAIMEAKFNVSPQDIALPGSTSLASLSKRVIEELISVLNEQGRFQEAADWSAWRILTPSRREWKIVRGYIQTCGPWLQWSVSQKFEYVYNLASPLQIGADLMEELKKFGDSFHLGEKC